MRVVLTYGGQWFRDGATVVDLRRMVVARDGHTACFKRQGRAFIGHQSVQFKLVLYVLSAFPRSVETSRLIDLVWGCDVDGGPENAEVVVRTLLHRANRVLLAVGLRIHVPLYGRGYAVEVLP